MSEHPPTPELYPTREQYLQHCGADAAVVRAAAQLQPDAPVPGLDGWSVLNLVEHLGDVYMHKVEVLRLGHPPDPWPPPGPDPEPFGWFDTALTQLLDELGSRSPDEPAWTFAPFDQSVGFWHRRMAHESAIHRQDAEGAVGVRTPIEDALAVDGVDEILGLVTAVPEGDDDVTSHTGTVEVRSGNSAWSLDVRPRRLTVTRGAPAAADLTLAGTPDSMLWWLWRGVDLGLDVSGDTTLLGAVREHISAVSG